MRKIAFLLLAILVATAVFAASPKGGPLDGTSWKVEVEPDKMTKEKGEKQFTDTLTFADGKVEMSECVKIGFAASPYTASKSGETEWTFNTQQSAENHGTSAWTGTTHDKKIRGKLVSTKKDGTILTYDFHGDKLD